MSQKLRRHLQKLAGFESDARLRRAKKNSHPRVCGVARFLLSELYQPTQSQTRRRDVLWEYGTRLLSHRRLHYLH